VPGWRLNEAGLEADHRPPVPGLQRRPVLPSVYETGPRWRMQRSGLEGEGVLSCDIGVEIGAGVGSVVDSVVLI
jgi:hypothetical protein